MLPWVDHGSPDLDTTLRMIRAAADQGTRTIVCTPHLFELDTRLVERAREVHREVAAMVREEAIPVRLLLGFEVDLTVAATCDLETLRTLCIGDPRAGEASGRALLVEMPYSGWPLFLEQTLFRLTAAGLLPILAHPERNERVQRSPDALAGCLNAGAIAQGTAGSLSSMFRKQSLKAFYELLARGWFGLLASDAHSQPKYTWSLEPCLAELGDRVSPADRELMTEVNPARVLQGESPVPLAPRPTADRGWRRFR